MAPSKITNMYEDELCGQPVTQSTHLRHGHYYGWLNHKDANMCVKAGFYDGESKEFRLVFPLKIDNANNTLRMNQSSTPLCLPGTYETIQELSDGLMHNTPLACTSRAPSAHHQPP